MYDGKVLEKCEAKMAKIDEMLDSDIVPALNKLRKERGDYMRWASDNSRVDRLRRFYLVDVDVSTS